MAELAPRLARIALGHVGREYPHKPGHVLTGPADVRTPRALHPVFYGSFDWHSCVHSFWLLARVLALLPDHPVAAEITRLLDDRLTDAAVAGECDTVGRPSARGFERPYGWAWLLKLQGALEPRWADRLRPLAAIIERRFADYLPIAPYPVRTGTHGNTAFALRMAADGASPALRPALREAVARWYGADRDCPAWDEPGGDDFLSPALVEAECVRRLLPERFAGWFATFLPRLAAGEPAALFRPAVATDRSDGKIAHLDGLNLSRAWCLRSLAAALPRGDDRTGCMERAAAAHLAAAMPHLDGHYMGEHWLATYALLAIDEGGQA